MISTSSDMYARQKNASFHGIKVNYKCLTHLFERYGSTVRSHVTRALHK